MFAYNEDISHKKIEQAVDDVLALLSNRDLVTSYIPFTRFHPKHTVCNVHNYSLIQLTIFTFDNDETTNDVEEAILDSLLKGFRLSL